MNYILLNSFQPSLTKLAIPKSQRSSIISIIFSVIFYYRLSDLKDLPNRVKQIIVIKNK